MPDLISIFKKIFSLKDLRNKLLFSLALVLVFRILAHIPIPSIDTAGLSSYFQNNQVLGLLDLFSGGSVSRFSIVMLGVGPYITSSIIMQLLQVAIPSLEELSKEGEYGKQKINQYTRYLSLPLAVIEAYGLIRVLQSQNVLGQVGISDIVLIIAIATAGATFLMWLGELISENGVGNGLSILISVGIIAGIPSQVTSTAQVLEGQYFLAAELILAAIAMIAFIVYINESERRVKISYARRIRAGKTVGTIDSYLPIKTNTAGVIPIIFATSFLVFPGILSQFLQSSSVESLKSFASKLSAFIANEYAYGAVFFVLVFAFTFFYTSIIFQPNQMAENLQKQGGFIPGIRPGNQTAQYLSGIIYKITFIGALSLSIIAIFPFVLQNLTGIRTLAISGTGILIIVSVTLDFVRQVKAQLAMRSYDDAYEYN